MSDERNATAQAILTVDAFVQSHRAAAIPALLGACVLWAVEHGGKDLVKGSLRNAIKLADEMGAAHRKGLS